MVTDRPGKKENRHMNVNELEGRCSCFMWEVDILHDLKKKYGPWLRKDLTEAVLIRIPESVVLFVNYRFCQSQWIPLDFISDDTGEPEAPMMFARDLDSNSSRDRFLHLDPYSLLLCFGDALFSDTGGSELEERLGNSSRSIQA
jgi:hypothetical protein